jgi:hypothetical protein
MTPGEFFDTLTTLSPLRVISATGPSVLETICRFERWSVVDGHMNAITETYHWHIDLARFRWVRSRNEVHARSGRQVLFFALAEDAAATPFQLVYLYRGPREDFDGVRVSTFIALHQRLGAGLEVTPQ